jgi:alkylation response protein AidB-like acyl-CoA dehydrogenase
MTIRAYAVESMLYRTAGLLDAAIGDGHADPAVMAAALEEFAVEASLLKIASSEMIDYVVDENVQIHGGNGFVRDYPAERRFLDARVNRIFEGTNEINRLLVPARLLKRAAQGGPAVLDESDATPGDPTPTPVAAIRRAARTLLREAAATLGDRLAEAQEVTMLLTDVLLAAFAAETVVLRAAAAEQANHPLAEIHTAAARTFVHDAGHRVLAAGSTVLEALHTGARRDEALHALRSLLEPAPFDTIAARRAIAVVVSERQTYIFG